MVRLVARFLRGVVRAVAGLAALSLALAVLTLAPGDPALYPPPGDDAVRIVVIDHGYHTGLVLPKGALRAAAARIGGAAPDLAARLGYLADLYPWAEWTEVGWGDAAFYQATPGIGDIDPVVALRALFLPTPSAVQVVPGWGLPEAAFPHSGHAVLMLSPAGFDRLAIELAVTLAPAGPDGAAPAPLGPALYGGGVFLPAEPSYHGLRTCNHWTSSLLRAAGVPSSWFLSTTSAGLMAELDWRAR